MLRMFEFRCPVCGEYHEKLVNDPVEDAPQCSQGHGKTAKIISTPAIKFKNGHGTYMGQSMSIAGRPLPEI